MFFNVLKYKKFCYICLFIVFILFCYLIYKNNLALENKMNLNSTDNALKENFKNNKNFINNNKSERIVNNNNDNDDNDDNDDDDDNDDEHDFNNFIDKNGISNKNIFFKNKDISSHNVRQPRELTNVSSVSTRMGNLENRFVDSVSLVLARYNEDINYIKNKEFENLNIYLYNKGEDIIDEDILKNKNIKIIKLPNVGKCDHTYLYHIIHNYNNLSNLIIFLPASFYYMNFKKYKGLKIIKDTKQYKKPVFPLKNLKKQNYLKLYDFNITYFKTRFKVNQIINNNKNNKDMIFKTKQSPIRPYGQWFEKVIDKKFKSCYDCEYVIYTGLFSVRKDMILKYNIDLYKKMISYIDDDINPEAGHYIERVWACLFYPFKDSLIINSR